MLDECPVIGGSVVSNGMVHFEVRNLWSIITAIYL